MLDFLDIQVQNGSKIELNTEIEGLLGWKDGQIYEKTGIKRYISLDDETTEFLALKSFLKLNPDFLNDIDTILSVSNTPSYDFPNISNFVLSSTDCSEDIHCLGINAGCTGYVDALKIIYSLFCSDQSRKAVILTSDTYSKHILENDRSIRSLFSDGATATLLEKNNDGFKIKDSVFSAKKNTEAALIRKNKDGVIHMNGPKVLQFALSKVGPQIKNILDKEDNCNFFPHQAGKIVLDNLASLSENNYKVFSNYENYGNLVSSSIPNLINQNFDEFRNSNLNLLSGFGVGLSHSSILLQK